MKITLATKITMIRLVLVPFVAMSILYHRYGTALLIFLFSGLTDMCDGLIARRWGQKSKLGALLDPMADKLLLSTTFLLLTLPASNLEISIPIWLAVVVFSRDLMIIIGAVAIMLTSGFTNFPPSIYGKISTFVQIVCVLLVLFANYLVWPGSFVEWVFYLTFATTFFSGAHYVYVFNKRFNTENE